jgi:hypothetical protein
MLSVKILDTLGDLRLHHGQSTHHSLDGGFWMVSCRKRPDGALDHLITLARGYPTGKEVQGLAWGLTAAAGPAASHRVGRTDARGQAWIRGLAPGEYRLRYVAVVRSVEDVEILEQLGDEPARLMLESAASDATLPGPVRGRAQRALQASEDVRDVIPIPLSVREPADEIPEPPREVIGSIADLLEHARGHQRDLAAVTIEMPLWARLRLGGYQVSVVAESLKKTGLSEPGSIPQRLPQTHAIEARTEFRELAMTLDSAEVPFGVVRILARGQSRGTLLGSLVAALPEYVSARGDRYRAGSVGFDAILKGQDDPVGVDYHVRAASDATLSWFTLDEVQELLQQPDVSDDPNLTADVNRLIERLRGPEAPHGR